MSVPATYGLVILIWTTTPLAIQWSSATMSPITALLLRMLISLSIALALLIPFGVRGLSWQKNWKLYLASGFGICPAMPLVYLGSQYIPSGLVSVLFGLSPFLIGLLSAIFLSDTTMTKGRYISLLIAIIGLGTIFGGGGFSGEQFYLGVGLLLLAVFVYSISSVLVKRHSESVHPIQQLAGSLLVATIALVIWWAVWDREMPNAFTNRSFYALIYLGVVGSVVGFVGYFFLIQRISVNLVSLIPLVTPALALWLGYGLNGEELTAELVGGSALIVCGLALFNLFRPRRSETV